MRCRAPASSEYRSIRSGGTGRVASTMPPARSRWPPRRGPTHGPKGPARMREGLPPLVAGWIETG